jgi:hypothetical protein
VLAAGWIAGVGMLLYGGVNFVVGAVVALLRALAVLETPADTSAFWWHLLLWDPWWILGGVLFSLAAWAYQRRSRADASVCDLASQTSDPRFDRSRIDNR